MSIVPRVKRIFLEIDNLYKKKQAKCAFFVLFIAAVFLDINNENVFRRFLTTREFTGDENKYMRMVQSLAADGDLDLSNLWFEKGEMREVWKKILSSESRQFGDFYFLAVNGGIYALHMPGVAFLLLPAYKLDSIVFPNDPKSSPVGLPFLPRKLLFTFLWLAALMTLNFGLLFRLTDHLFKSAFLAVLIFFFLIYHSPFPTYSFTVFPGCSAAFFFLLALNCILFPFRMRKINDCLLVLGTVFLPWLHQRFIPLSGGLFLAFVINNKGYGSSRKRLLLVSLALIVLSLPYFYYFYSLTGNPSPFSTSEYFGRVHFSPKVIPLGFFGLLFSPSQGSIWRYRWMILFFFGMYWAFKKDKKVTSSLLVPALLYYLVCAGSTILGGGASPPGRFLLPLFPIFLIFVGFVFQDLLKQFSYSKLAFYVVFLSLFFFSKRMLLFHFADRYAKPPFYNYIFTEPVDLGWIIESVAIISMIFLLIFLSDRFLFARKRIMGKKKNSAQRSSPSG
ncbi:MAG: hypothetical protein QHH14_00280 [Clostridiales bacterium]|nr:hypothetical protein [Clostridiales bacterium]